MKIRKTSWLRRLIGRLALPGWVFLVILCLGASMLFFPPSVGQIIDPYVYAPGFPTPVSIFPYPVDLAGAGACANKCLIDVCVHWIPGPSDRCPHPGTGGGCCIESQTRCVQGCEVEDRCRSSIDAGE